MARTDYLAAFVRGIYRDLAAEAASEAGPGLLFMRKGQGTLILSRDDIPAYADVVARLHKGYGAQGDVSLRLSRRTCKTCYSRRLAYLVHRETMPRLRAV